MSAFVVVQTDHKTPRYIVASKLMGKDSYAVLCTAKAEYQARLIADALNSMYRRPAITSVSNRKRA